LRRATLMADMPPIILENVSVLLKAEAAALVLKEANSGELVVVLGQGAWADLTGARLTQRGSISMQVISNGEVFKSS
jgi:hypothetical protein